MQDPVRWGILGCARIAIGQVMPAMMQVKGAEIWAVASRSLEKAEKAASAFSANAAYGSYEALLDDPDVEAVYIPLPNHLHKPWAIAAVRSGKHVLCEKPIALNAAEAREMQAAARESRRFLLEAFMYRFSPVVQRAMQMIRDGILGEPRAIHSIFSFLLSDDPSNIRLQANVGGGALYDAGSYCINVQRTLSGREPRLAWASFSWSPKYHVDMGGVGVLDFGDQLYGTFFTGFNAQQGSYFRVSGTKGTLEAPLGFLGREKEAELVLTANGRMERMVLEPANPYVLEIEDMCAALRGERAALFGGEPLEANMRVIDACYASDKAGQAVEV